MTYPDDPTLYVGTYDTTDCGGGAHQDMTTVTAVWDPTVYGSKHLHPEGTADLVNPVALPEEPSQTSDEPPKQKARTRASKKATEEQ